MSPGRSVPVRCGLLSSLEAAKAGVLKVGRRPASPNVNVPRTYYLPVRRSSATVSHISRTKSGEQFCAISPLGVYDPIQKLVPRVCVVLVARERVSLSVLRSNLTEADAFSGTWRRGNRGGNRQDDRATGKFLASGSGEECAPSTSNYCFWSSTASGKKSCFPLTLKSPMIFCPSGPVM